MAAAFLCAMQTCIFWKECHGHRTCPTSAVRFTVRLGPSQPPTESALTQQSRAESPVRRSQPLAQWLPAAVPLAQRLQLVLAPLPEAQALEPLEAALRLGFVRLALQPQQPQPQSLLLLPQRREI